MKKELSTTEEIIQRREKTKARIEKKLQLLKENYDEKKAVNEKKLKELNIEIAALKKN